MTSPATGDAGPRRHGTGEGQEGGTSYAKAVFLTAVAVVLCVVLLNVGGKQSPASTASAVVPTTTVPAAGATTTTTTAPAGAGHQAPVSGSQPSTSVKVLVANGGTVTGAAKFFAQKLGGLGWGTLTPTTTTTKAAASAVYYASADKTAASAIAASLGLKTSVVQPISSSVPVNGATAASVVLIVGPDLATQVTATATAAK